MLSSVTVGNKLPTLRHFSRYAVQKCPVHTKPYRSLLGLNPTVRYTSAHTWWNCTMSSAVVCGVLAFVVFMLSNAQKTRSLLLFMSM
ncbi:MAG: hypothetical protein IJV56_00475 [Neisseriaceae bacterium]|nr:hypothetical protein [Neisseriaceae bacterium]